MTRECLKKHCEATCEKFKDVPTSNIYEEHRLVLDLLEQTRWIPVSEKLPDKSGDYWCTFGGTGLTGSDYYTTESDAKKIFDDPEEYAGWRSQNVIAWMPLSRPYKPTDSDCNSCKYQNEVDGSNCYECVKGIHNNYTADTEKEV